MVVTVFDRMMFKAGSAAYSNNLKPVYTIPREADRQNDCPDSFLFLQRNICMVVILMVKFV